MNKIAIIDCGTNTFNLLIAQQNETTVEQLFSTKIPVKIGAGALLTKQFTADGINRAKEALSQHKKTIESFNVTTIYAFATEAFRQAKNAVELVEWVQEHLGFTIQIISGEQEAEWITKGVQYAGIELNTPSLIIDIGGGSTEFIIVENNAIQLKQSFQLGVSRLKDYFNFRVDPIPYEQQKLVMEYITKALDPLKIALSNFSIGQLIGCSGSFETLYEIEAHKQRMGPPEKTIYAQINLRELEIIMQDLLAMNKEERLNVPGMLAMRADMIPFSVLLIQVVLNLCSSKQIIASYYSLKEGVLFDKLLNKQ